MSQEQRQERLHSLAQDLRFALRQFRKAPAFTAIAAITLALGIGATTAIFSVVSGVVLQPLPFPHSEQIVQLFGIDAKGRTLTNFADPTFDDLAAHNRSLSAIAEYNQYGMSVASEGDVERVGVSGVSKQFFDVLGVKPTSGRFFLPEEQQLGAPMAVVISHGLWMRAFGASSKAIGARLMNGTTPLTVVGVMPAGREYPANVDLWYPREIDRKNTSYTAHNWKVIARVKDGVAVERASADVSLVLRRLHDAVGDATWTVGGKAVELRAQIVGKIRPLLLLILAASAVLLLIACANVANLLIARMAVRESELAVRVALGAGRGRLTQQLLVETSLLAAIGCVGGLALAEAGMRVLLALRPALIPRLGEVHLDWRVTAFALVVAAITAIGLGLVAAWRGTGGDLRAALSQSQRTQGGGGASYRIRGTLVVVQLAMTVVLLIGASLLARSFVRLMTIDPGFRTTGVAVAGLTYDTEGDSARVAGRRQYLDQLIERAQTLPGVTSVGVTCAEPFGAGCSNGTFLVLPSADVKIAPQDFERLFRDKDRTGSASYQWTSEGYFKAMNVPLVQGRLFNEGDRAGAPDVAVINASLAKKQWPGESAIGKVIEFGNIDGDLTPMTIVGVVGDTHEQDLASDPAPIVYVSYRQRPGNGGDVFVEIAGANEASTIAGARQAFRQVRADVPMRFETIESIIGQSVASQRFMLVLVGVFGAVALLLATLGVYSIIGYLVAQREREISIRVALGARAADVVRIVLGQGIVLAVTGTAIGGVVAVAATRVLKQLLYQVSTTDPVSFAAVLVVLCVVAVVASYVPARRVARVDPMEVLRGA